MAIKMERETYHCCIPGSFHTAHKTASLMPQPFLKHYQYMPLLKLLSCDSNGPIYI